MSIGDLDKKYLLKTLWKKRKFWLPTRIFSFSPKFFYKNEIISPKQISLLLMSANASTLDWSKILSFDKDLNPFFSQNG